MAPCVMVEFGRRKNTQELVLSNLQPRPFNTTTNVLPSVTLPTNFHNGPIHGGRELHRWLASTRPNARPPWPRCGRSEDSILHARSTKPGGAQKKRGARSKPRRGEGKGAGTPKQMIRRVWDSRTAQSK